MAEREQAHRHRQDLGQLALSFVTRLAFLVLALAILGVAVLMIHVGQPIAGLGALVGELALFAGVFIWGQRDQ